GGVEGRAGVRAGARGGKSGEFRLVVGAGGGGNRRGVAALLHPSTRRRARLALRPLAVPAFRELRDGVLARPDLYVPVPEARPADARTAYLVRRSRPLFRRAATQ